MVYAQAVDSVAGGGRGSDLAVVDSGRSASGTVLVDDRKVSWIAGATGLGGGVGGSGAAVHRRRIERLFAGAWESAQSGQHGFAGSGADDDGGGLGSNVLRRTLEAA